jgi:GTPase
MENEKTPLYSPENSQNSFLVNIEKVVPLKEWDEENDLAGGVEYKLKLINLDQKKIQKRITQMFFRLREGNGKCIYDIGLEDNGNPLGLNEEELKGSLNTLYYMTQQIGANMEVLNYHQGKEGLIAEILVTHKKEIENKDKIEISIGLLGEENAGKSTLVRNIVN